MTKDGPRDFPVVGIGASAGGLAACTELLEALPDDAGAAFIVVQHLDPASDSHMAELLQTHTTMPVVQAKHDVALEPNHVYVIPPDKFLALGGRGLFLEPPEIKRGVRMSIDHFFRSLAEVRGARAIGVLLSGTGNDGTHGIREIKAVDGVVFVQSPDTAEFGSMPGSAVETGLVDFVLPIGEMAEPLVRCIRHPVAAEESEKPISADAPSAFNAIMGILRGHTEHDFRTYKPGTLERRIRRRMALRQIAKLQEYADYLRGDPDEVMFLFKDILIGVTRFFRDPDEWNLLVKEVLEPLVAKKAPGDPVRIWVPGCSTGEEVYTLAVLLHQEMDNQDKELRVQIYATDLNADAVAAGRAANYPPSIAADIPAEYLTAWFQELPRGEGFRVDKRVRESVVFATQNVISDPPFSRLDLISCRNLMIYLRPPVQRRLIEIFHFALVADGHLLLGHSEGAERPARLFQRVSTSHQLYQRQATVRQQPGSFPMTEDSARGRVPENGEPSRRTSPADAARRLLLKRFVPASVLVDRRLEVQFFHGPVRDYLDFPSGEPTSQLTDMALDDLRRPLATVLSRTFDTAEPVEIVVAQVHRGAAKISVRLSAEPMTAPFGDERLVLVSFADVGEATGKKTARGKRAAAPAEQPGDDGLVRQLEHQLQATREDLQSTVEEMETSNEELKASNEEVLSMNEELQSANEELEVSREELQALNQELSTVNDQLQQKIAEVEATSNDLSNLLVSTNIATIFLDTELRIRRFTPAAQDLLGFTDAEVGCPIGEVSDRVIDDALAVDAREVLDQLQSVEANAAMPDGRHFMRRVRPYRTRENRIEGVVITYTDITSVREATEGMRKRERQQQAIVRLGQMALAGRSLDALLEQATTDAAAQMGVSFAKLMELDHAEASLVVRAGVGWKSGHVGQTRVDIGGSSQSGYALQRASPVIVEDFATERRFTASPLLADHGIRCGASVVVGPVKEPWGVLGVHDTECGKCDFDVDDMNFLQAVANTLWFAIIQKRAANDIEAEQRELRQFIDAMPFELAVISAEERYLIVNAAYSVWGRELEEIEGMQVADLIDADAYAEMKPHIDGVLGGEPQRFEMEISPAGTGPFTRLTTYAPRLDADGEVAGFYSATVDITPLKEAQLALAERTAQYRTIGESIPYGVWVCDGEGELTYVSDSFLEMVGLSAEEAMGTGWTCKLVPGTAEEALKTWRTCVKTGKEWEYEHRFLSADGEERTVLSLGRPIRDTRGTVTSWSGLNLDITERKREEARAQIITAELDHRVKNILATVGSIARLSGRSATSVDEYRHNFEARIQALARAHQTLAASKWDGLPLRRQIEEELSPYLNVTTTQISIEGPPVLLAPFAAQAMSLAVHELATNAAKYGALSDDGGALDIRWSFEPEGNTDGAAPGVRFEWLESGLKGVKAPDRHGFGTTVLRDVAPAQCSAEVELEFRDTGLAYRLDLPATCLRGN